MDAKEKGIALLSSTSGVDMKTAQKNILYYIPSDKIAYITHVVIRDPSASMAGGTDYDIGTGANADTWKQAIDLSSLITLGTDYIVINSDNVKYTESGNSSEFGIKVITGTTAACTATIDVFGYIV